MKKLIQWNERRINYLTKWRFEHHLSQSNMAETAQIKVLMKSSLNWIRNSPSPLPPPSPFRGYFFQISISFIFSISPHFFKKKNPFNYISRSDCNLLPLLQIILHIAIMKEENVIFFNCEIILQYYYLQSSNSPLFQSFLILKKILK